MNFLNKIIAMVIIFCFSATLLSACGKKSSDLEPPLGSDYPREYPSE